MLEKLIRPFNGELYYDLIHFHLLDRQFSLNKEEFKNRDKGTSFTIKRLTLKHKTRKDIAFSSVFTEKRLSKQDQILYRRILFVKSVSVAGEAISTSLRLE